MAFKEFQLEDGTPVVVYKRRGSKSLRLSITSTGKVRVTIPTWTPYQAGLQFARSRGRWIEQHKAAPSVLRDGQLVGKAHHLKFSPQPSAQRISSRVLAGQIIVGHPAVISADDERVQKVARAACIRALRKQAEQLLPERLASLAEKQGFRYRSVAVKQLKSRWGSCDQSQNIVFNLFLMQLPWQSIDYVIVHELIHTRVMDHGPDFWELFESVLPSAKSMRREMRQYQPVLFTANPPLEK